MNYNIGQILFVVLNNKNQVYPMKVIEVITKRTLQGEDVKYVLQAGTGSKTVMLDQIDGEFFDSSDKARTILVERATRQIHRLIDSAIKKADEWYKANNNPAMQTIDDLPDLDTKSTHIHPQQLDNDSSTVMLPDGTLAKVKLPSAI